MKDKRRDVRAAVAVAMLIMALLSGGCVERGSRAVNPANPDIKARGSGGGAEAGSVQVEEEKCANPESEKEAAREAVDYAEDSNPGSTFEPVEVDVAGGWARVTLEEVGVPAEEAVGFCVFLRKTGVGWDVVTTGTDVDAEDVPYAPAELFD